MRNSLTLLLSALVWAALCCACSDDEEGQLPVTVADKTVLVYMAADNSLASFALDDLEEIKTGMLNMRDEDLHLLVYIDTGTDPRLLKITTRDGAPYEEVLRTYPSRNSVGTQEMGEVFRDAFTAPQAQARSYGLIFWSHADGWIPYENPLTRWIGQDKEGRNTYQMNVGDFAAVLRDAPHFDFIFFDACFMLSIEVAYELRGFADFYIASPTETPGPGAPYDILVPLMAADNAAVRMAEANFAYYESMYNGGIGISNGHWTGGVSVGVLRTGALEYLASLTRQLLPAANVPDAAMLRQTLFDCDRRTDGHVGYYDLCGFMQALLSADDFRIWSYAYGQALPYWATTPLNYSQFANMFSMEESSGATQYVPEPAVPTDFQAYATLQWYTDAGLSKLGWEDMFR